MGNDFLKQKMCVYKHQMINEDDNLERGKPCAKELESWEKQSNEASDDQFDTTHNNKKKFSVPFAEEKKTECSVMALNLQKTKFNAQKVCLIRD